MIAGKKDLEHENSFYSIFRNLVDQKAKISVELKNDGLIKGTLKFIDQNMNMLLVDIEPEEATFSKTILMTSCFVRGSSVKFIHIHKNELDLNLIEEAWKQKTTE